MSWKILVLNDYIDVIIPRGGAGLIKNVVNNSTVPVIETGTGNCHVYVDEYADIDIEISSDDKYKNVVISDKIDILTPGLNRILGNPYEIKVERKIPNV